MKNFIKSSILFLAITALTVCSAQAQITTVQNGTVYNSGSGGTYKVVANTATGALYAPNIGGISQSGYEGFMTVTAWLTNASGTTAGNIFLQGSLDSTHWDYIYGANGISASSANLGNGYPGIGSGIDTFITTATNLTKTWRVNPLTSPYLRVNYVGSGTHSDTLRARFKLNMKR